MIRLLAPAKLNLYLRVLGKRPDGYHEIETVFERIDLADELTFEPSPDAVHLTCTDPTLSCGEENLIIKAARLLQESCGVRDGARIHLIKCIPIAAGLGGGSSDAAAALLGLHRLWNLGLDGERLSRLAARLGSDVPFFLSEGAFAIGRGRGERCEPLTLPGALSHVLVVPDARLSTKDIYAGARFDLTASKPSISMLLHALHNGSLSELAEGLWNDLEPEAIRRCPIITTIKIRLRELGCLAAALSGSGPSVFGLCLDPKQAQIIAEQFRAQAPPAWHIEVIRTDQGSRSAPSEPLTRRA